ncbi:hypothetical protein BKH36_11725 [Actinomyces naeslundii]|uniref:FtsX-like permease family protein n=1 Tax=Actinomyces naeslundii TaxID=1655 RepID=UPI00096CC285|nr:ABC transporter permease [Actinomyces naeslundii]OMG25254.1 hypothetical protein BKH36_11725 [Actinomyces naeslundii]
MPSLLDVRRTAAALVAVALAAALIVFAFIVSDSFATQLTASARASVGDADVVVLPQRGQELDPDSAQKVAVAPGVASVRPYIEGSAWIDRPGVTHDTHAFVLDTAGADKGLVAGRLPEGAGEIAVSEAFVQSEGLGLGDAVSLKGERRTGADATGTAAIVGIVRPTASMTRENLQGVFIFTTDEERSALGVGSAPSVLYVSAKDGISISELKESVSRIDGKAETYTAEDIVTMRAVNGRSGLSMTLTLLNIMGPVCAVVAGIVIATTFTALVARQTQQIGLLRCVGARRGQVRLAVLRVALTIGITGSILGGALGVGAAVALIGSGVIDGVGARQLTITPASLGVTVGLATVVALVSALRPAYQAARTSPLIAITGSTADDKTLGRTRFIMAILGILLAVAGCGLVWYSITIGEIAATATGAVLIVLGILTALPLLVVGSAHFITFLAAPQRTPVLHLAARNLARNPTRTAATTAGLLITVSIATTTATGLASQNDSISSFLAARCPVDIIIQPITSEVDSAALTHKIQAVDGVQATSIVPEMFVQVASGAKKEQMSVLVLDRAAVAPVTRAQKDLEALDNSTLLVGRSDNLPEGTLVTLTGPSGSVALTTHVVQGVGRAVTPDVADKLGGQTSNNNAIMWIRTSGDGSSTQAANAVRAAVRSTGLAVSASSDTRTAFTTLVARATAVTVAILGLAVLITLSGLVNVVDISVLERTREIGILRATGIQRHEVRRLIAVESLLTALVGGVIGGLVGIPLGIAGLAALLGPDGLSSLAPTVPWMSILGILFATAAIGVLTALRPACNAASISPVTALAVE